MYNKKVCILGASGVGKSSLIHRFLNEKFSEALVANSGARIDKIVQNVDREKVQLMLWDIQGENQAPHGFAHYLKGASAVIYVVDGTRLNTLKTAMEFRQESERRLGAAMPSIILFNKSDLASDWEISSNMISDVESDGIFAILTSCKEGTGVDTAFNLITRVIMGKTALMTNCQIPSSPAGTETQIPSHF